jgi:hypothetical protein
MVVVGVAVWLSTKLEKIIRSSGTTNLFIFLSFVQAIDLMICPLSKNVDKAQREDPE